MHTPQTFCAIVILLPLLVTGCEQASSRTPIPRKGGLPQVTSSRFEAEVLESELPVLVEVGTDRSCAFCEAMRPRVAQVAQQFEGKAKVVRVDFRAEAELARRLGVTVCPTYLVFSNGRTVARSVGETPTPMLISQLDAATSSLAEHSSP